jgi:hypothetical protein
VSCHTTLRGNQGRLEIAAGGGADRRSAKHADAPMDQSREAHRSARPLHAPRGGMTSGDPAARRRRGTRVARVGTRVPTSVGFDRLATLAPGPEPAGLRSLPAKQHAPKARPPPATDRGRRAGGWPGSRSNAIEACGRTRRLGGAAFGGRPIQQPTSPAVPSRLTLGQWRRSCATSLRASLVASTPGGGAPPGPPPAGGGPARALRGCYVLSNRWTAGQRVQRLLRGADPS